MALIDIGFLICILHIRVTNISGKWVDMEDFICQTLHLLGGRGRLKEGGVHQLFLILGDAFIGGRSLKEGGRLLEDLP